MNEFERKRQHFVDRMAMIFDGMGLTALSGRILGWLLVCEPEMQSAEQLAEATGGSKGGISMTTRMLEQMRLIHRVKPQGSRKVYWVIRSGVWSDMMAAKAGVLDEWLKLAREGVELMKEKPEEMQGRVEEMLYFYKYFQVRLHEMLDEWEEHLAEKKEAGR